MGKVLLWKQYLQNHLYRNKINNYDKGKNTNIPYNLKNLNNYGNKKYLSR